VWVSIQGASGTIDERDAQITRSGMYAEYPAIIRGYYEMFSASENDPARLEALKRAVFLVWYSFTVPSTESGISELAETSVRDIMAALQWSIEHGPTDEELRLMVAWYRDTFAAPFEFFGPVKGLDAWIRDVSSDDARTALASSTWTNRGQLGVYWASVTGGR
jgi:hypothetical protein